MTKLNISTIIGSIYYSKDTQHKLQPIGKKGSSRIIKIMLNLDINKVNQLPFKEIMEIINANNGFFYNKNSRET